MQRKKALVTGITGQDGSYLCELLLEKGYEVHGIIRRSSSFNTGRIMHLFQDLHEDRVDLILHYGDLGDSSSLQRLIATIQPDEIYNLGAQSHVRVSFEIPEYTTDIVALGAIRILEAIRESGIQTKYYQASSSEMFGRASEIPQKETTPFQPQSPYAAAKVYAYWLTRNYRDAYKLFACNGILFNHESPRRGETFVTRKITRGIARILAGKEKKLYLGNLEARRDWGYAKDYVYAMWLIMQHEEPDDYVIATGESYSVRDFLEEAFKQVDLTWTEYVEIDPRYYRPLEVDHLLGDASKARTQLGWKPTVTFRQLVGIMLRDDLTQQGVVPPYGCVLEK